MADRKTKWFGTDGIRGKANNGILNAGITLLVGQAAGVKFRRTNGDDRPKVVIGKDTRLSSYMLERTIEGGFMAAGMDVIETGPVPTPGLAMIMLSMRADLGVMITASHNQYEDNGIKFFGPDGYKISDEDELEIEALMQSPDLDKMLALSPALGRAKRVENISERYVEFAKRSVPKGFQLDGVRVVVDCANGAGYKVAPQVLRELGAEVFTIGVDPDGYNINFECGSTAPMALRRKVKELRADIGIALDGDADRVLLVDERGNEVDGDQVLAVIAESWISEGSLKGGCVVGTDLTNSGFERHLEQLGVKLERASVGDRYVLERMRTTSSNLGGEQSGHIIMSDHTTSGDGLIAALQVLTVIGREGKKASEVCHRFEPVPQISKNVPKKAGTNPLDDPAVKHAIEDGRRLLGGGRLVVRNSGTEPKVRIMGEGEDSTLVEGVVKSIAAAVEKAG